MAERIDASNNHNLLKRETRFGVYGIVLVRWSTLPVAIRRNLEPYGKGIYLEMHVPDPVEDNGSSMSLGPFRDGLEMLAEYQVEHMLNYDMFGVTWGNVAIPARKFLHFDVIEGIKDEDLDRKRLKRINIGFNQTKRALKNRPRGPIYLCVQSFESLMRNFAKQKPLMESISG